MLHSVIRTQIQLSDAQSERLKRLAAAEGKSVAELIRRSVEEYLKTRRPVPPAEMRRRALEVVGRFRSDVTDLGTDHDRHFTESLGD